MVWFTCSGSAAIARSDARGKVFVATANGHLVALDAVTGQQVWQRVWCDVRAGESATMAPLVVKNLVIVGSSGAEYGVRGHIDAFDIETGQRVWRRYNVPKPGEPGSETWARDNDAWARGGRTAWITGTYDPELDLLYWGTGNPGPDFDGSGRRGDNLYTSCVLALDPDDGSLKWHYQWTPHDVWDYDGVNENILFDRDGRKLLAHFDKNGYLFILDRTNGQFVRASKFARATWGDIDPKTGKVTVLQPPTPQGVLIQPGPAGAKEWPHAAYSPKTGLLYAPIIESTANFKIVKAEFKESLPYWGGEAMVVGEHWGAVKAFDPATGREVWLVRNPHPMVASVLATGGDLVITGRPTGEVVAYHARTGEVLWEFQTGSIDGCGQQVGERCLVCAGLLSRNSPFLQRWTPRGKQVCVRHEWLRSLREYQFVFIEPKLRATHGKHHQAQTTRVFLQHFARWLRSRSGTEHRKSARAWWRDAA